VPRLFIGSFILISLIPAYSVLVWGQGWQILATSTSIEEQMPVFYRLLGIYAFHFLTLQILLGSFRSRVAGWLTTEGADRFRIGNGLFTYILAFLHPVLIYINFYLLGGISALETIKTSFLPLAMLLSQISLLLLTFLILSGLLKKHLKDWPLVHWLNYAVFLLVFVKSVLFGNTNLPPVSFMYIIYGVIVAAALLNQVSPLFKQRKLSLLEEKA
jgi:hypothetical protein